MNRDSGTATTNRRWLKRLVRRLVVILLGEHNAINLYKENTAAEQIQAYAKERGLPVIPLGSIRDNSIIIVTGLNWAVYPLPNAEKQHTKKKHKNISLWQKIKLYRQARNHAASTDSSDGLPPVTYLKPGERITHIVINAKSPNEKS